MENNGVLNEEKKQGNIFMQLFSPTYQFFSLLLIPTKKQRTILEMDDQSHTRRKKSQSTEVLLKRLLFKIYP